MRGELQSTIVAPVAAAAATIVTFIIHLHAERRSRMPAPAVSARDLHAVFTARDCGESHFAVCVIFAPVRRGEQNYFPLNPTRASSHAKQRFPFLVTRCEENPRFPGELRVRGDEVFEDP